MSTKYWAMIASNRPHIYSLGKHKDLEEAVEFSEEFVTRKNLERQQKPAQEQGSEFEVLWIMDEEDLRRLISEVHRPLVIARVRPTIAVETLPAAGTTTETTEGGEPEETETPCCGGNCGCHEESPLLS